jgi:hypothetical protein
VPAVAPASARSKYDGWVIPSFETGAILVQDEKGKTIRLSWEDAKQRDRRRYLAPGKYTVHGYRLYRKDRKSREWILSATGPRIRGFQVDPGKEARVSIEETVQFAGGMKASAAKVDVTMQFGGEGHSGLTVYADGRRIPVGFVLSSPSGDEIARGPMNYG